MCALVSFRNHVPRPWRLPISQATFRHGRRDGFRMGMAFCVTMALSITASAQPGDDDDVIVPPPGTPGSTVSDDVVIPPGTPGSTVSDDVVIPPGTPGSTVSDDVIVPPPGTPGSTVPAGTKSETAPRPSQARQSDDFDVLVSSKTFLRMFQRRYLMGFTDPGPEDETIVPIYEYVSLRAQRIDAPWGRDSISFQLSGWGFLDMGDISEERRITGDLMDANITGRFGSTHLTLGRQLTRGGPALVTRFDGMSVGFHDPEGFGADGYAGLTVRPRFRQRREYVLLGSAAESALRQPDALPSTSVGEGWLSGGRLSYRVPNLLDAGLSFHEQRERGELERRWGAMDLHVTPVEEVMLGTVGTLDLDSGRLVELRGFADVEPIEALTTTAEVLHTSPSLFLSRGSVLSVFSLDTVTEAGAEVAYRLTPAWTVAGSGHVQWFSEDGTGHRWGARTRIRLMDNLIGQVKYSRVREEELGYHAFRGSLSMELSRAWTATTALQHYRYSQAIRGVSSSTYGSATVEFGFPEEAWRVMVGGLATRSPYAALEAEALARLSIDLDPMPRRQQP